MGNSKIKKYLSKLNEDVFFSDKSCDTPLIYIRTYDSKTDKKHITQFEYIKSDFEKISLFFLLQIFLNKTL